MVEPKNALNELITILQRMPASRWEPLPLQEPDSKKPMSMEGFKLKAEKLEIKIETIRLSGQAVSPAQSLTLTRDGYNVMRIGDYSDLYMHVTLKKSAGAIEDGQAQESDDITLNEIYDILARR